MFGLVKESKLNALQKKYDELILRLDKCREIEDQLQVEISQLKSKINELEKQIREQTEADLFFTSAQIQKKLLDGEKKENIHELILQQNYYQQLLAQQQLSYQPSSFLQGLGLGGVFGGY